MSCSPAQAHRRRRDWFFFEGAGTIILPLQHRRLPFNRDRAAPARLAALLGLALLLSACSNWDYLTFRKPGPPLPPPPPPQTSTGAETPDDDGALDDEPAEETEVVTAAVTPPRPRPPKAVPPPKHNPETLVGLNGDQTSSLLGAPDDVRDEASGVVWSYSREKDCTLDVVLYSSVDSNELTVLQYNIKATDPANADRDPTGEICVGRLVKSAHANSPE